VRILITGASGQLGSYLLRELRNHTDTVVAWSGSRTGELFGFPLRPINVTDKDAVATAFRAARPAAVIHTAALTSLERCFRDPPAAKRINVEATTLLAELAAETRARLLLVSTDLVFGGEQGWYREQDVASPLSVYGQTKLAAEHAALASPDGAVTRVSLLFGPTLGGRPSFFDEQVAALQERRPCTLFEDEWRTPLGLVTAAQWLLAIVNSPFQGFVHMGGPERMSRLEMGQRLAAFLGRDPSVIVPATRTRVASMEPRPRDTSLDSTHCRELFPRQTWPTWDDAMRQMVSA
jgi:dTDP-4-dehydrorhamnose reductase